MAKNLEDIWEDATVADENGGENWVISSFFLERAYFSNFKVSAKLGGKQGEWMDRDPFSVYISVEAIAFVDAALLAREEQGHVDLSVPAETLEGLFTFFDHATAGLDQDHLAGALADQDEPFFYSTQKSPAGQGNTLEIFTNLGDWTDNGSNLGLWLAFGNVAKGVGLAAGRHKDPNTAGASQPFADACSAIYGYSAQITGADARNRSAFELSDGVAQLARAYATMPAELKQHPTSYRTLKAELSMVVTYSTHPNPLSTVVRMGRLDAVLSHHTTLSGIMKYAPAGDRRSSVDRIAKAAGLATPPTTCADLVTLEHELVQCAFVIGGLGSGANFAQVLSELRGYVSSARGGAGAASEPAFPASSVGNDARSEGRSLWGGALQQRITQNLNCEQVTSAIKQIQLLDRNGGDYPSRGDPSAAILETISKSGSPLLWSLVLNGTPRSLVTMYPGLGRVHTSRFSMGRQWTSAIKSVQASSASSASSSEVAAFGGALVGAPSQSYSADAKVIGDIARGGLTLSLLCVEFSRAFSAEMGDVGVTNRSFGEWLTQPGTLDYFIQYLGVALPVAGLRPETLIFVLNQVRAALGVAVGDAEMTERIIDQTSTAIDFDLAAAKDRRRAELETFELTFSDMVFVETAEVVKQVHASRRAIAALLPGASDAMATMSAGGARGAGGSGAAKFRKTVSLRAASTSHSQLDALELYRDDEKVKVYDDYLLYLTSRRVYAYRKDVVEVCRAALESDGTKLQGKVLRMDSLLSPAQSAKERAKDSDNLKPHHVVKEPKGWELKRSTLLESDFQAPPRS